MLPYHTYTKHNLKMPHFMNTVKSPESHNQVGRMSNGQHNDMFIYQIKKLLALIYSF